MTPLPKRRLSTRRQGDRRSHFFVKLVQTVICFNCKKPIIPHSACLFCGYYRGKMVKKVGKTSK